MKWHSHLLLPCSQVIISLCLCQLSVRNALPIHPPSKGSNSQVLAFPAATEIQLGPVCPSGITYSLGSQLINNSLSCPSAGAGGNGLNFPGFFLFFACSQPLAAFHPRSSSRCCAASSRRSTRCSGASWGSHCWVRAGMLGQRGPGAAG